MPALRKEILDIRVTTECGFTLKRERNMTRTQNLIKCTDKYSQHSSIIWPVCLNGWVFIYELSGCAFMSNCNNLNFIFRTCFGQRVPWHWGNYRVWIHSETGTWQGKNTESNAPYIQVLTTQFNHLVSLVKCLSVCLWTKWLWVQVKLYSLKRQTLRLLQARIFLIFR